MLEVFITLVILTVGMLGFLQISNTAITANRRAAKQIIAQDLAAALMSEIMSKRFDETEPPGTAIGQNGTETRFGGTAFDDVDDYNNFTEPTPPTTIGNLAADGSAGRPDYTGFSRSVSGIKFVHYSTNTAFNNENPTVPPATDFKKITVRVVDPYGRVTEVWEVKTR